MENQQGETSPQRKVNRQVLTNDTVAINVKGVGARQLGNASKHGDRQSVLRLLEARVNVNVSTDRAQWRALHHAAANGHLECIRLLFEAKADLQAKTHKFRSSALHRAAASGQLGSVKLLLALKANVNALGKAGFTPLHDACRYGQATVVQQLLCSKADLNLAVATNGRFPLHYAAGYGHLQCCLLLMRQLGTNLSCLSVLDKEGCSPLQLAKSYTNARYPLEPIQHVVDLLEAACCTRSANSDCVKSGNHGAENESSNDGEKCPWTIDDLISNVGASSAARVFYVLQAVRENRHSCEEHIIHEYVLEYINAIRENLPASYQLSLKPYLKVVAENGQTVSQLDVSHYRHRVAQQEDILQFRNCLARCVCRGVCDIRGVDNWANTPSSLQFRCNVCCVLQPVAFTDVSVEKLEPRNTTASILAANSHQKLAKNTNQSINKQSVDSATTKHDKEKNKCGGADKRQTHKSDEIAVKSTEVAQAILTDYRHWLSTCVIVHKCAYDSMCRDLDLLRGHTSIASGGRLHSSIGIESNGEGFGGGASGTAAIQAHDMFLQGHTAKKRKRSDQLSKVALVKKYSYLLGMSTGKISRCESIGVSGCSKLGGQAEESLAVSKPQRLPESYNKTDDHAKPLHALQLFLDRHGPARIVRKWHQTMKSKSINSYNDLTPKGKIMSTAGEQLLDPGALPTGVFSCPRHFEYNGVSVEGLKVKCPSLLIEENYPAWLGPIVELKTAANIPLVAFHAHQQIKPGLNPTLRAGTRSMQDLASLYVNWRKDAILVQCSTVLRVLKHLMIHLDMI